MARNGSGKVSVTGATIITLLFGWLGVLIVSEISSE
tara:strand:+ start:1078 stop:1185 length:108 start_codon:yes stop_codon:yes gene_type:complete